MYCNKCRNIYSRCCCSSKPINNTIINSEQAGQDGLSAYEIAVFTGKFTGTESEFVDWNRGEKGDKGDPGPQGESGDSVYSLTEW